MNKPEARAGTILSGEKILLEDQKLPDAKVDPKLDEKLTAALLKGHFLHGFRSGGGLRVFRMEKGGKDGKLIGYGEHPNAMEALSLLAEDLSVLGRAYKSVYGKLHPHYLTGSSSPQNELDNRILHGDSVDAYMKNKKIEFVISGYSEYHATKEIMAQAKKQPGVGVLHENRGCQFETVFGFEIFPGGQDRSGWTTRVVSLPKGMAHHRATMWTSTQTGCADTFFEAMERAFVAPEMEVKDRYG